MDYTVEANKFHDKGYFDSELGNTMPLALSTALQLSLVIFSNDIHTPTMCVTPEVVTTEAVMFLVYDSTGKGHYDAAIPAFKHPKVDRTNAIVSKSCRCGVNKKSATTKSCKPCPIYTTRCKCYKESRPCNALCQCVSCANPHGQRLQHSKEDERVRRKHPLQVEIPKSKRFAEERGEIMSAAIWSHFETILLNELCTTLLDQPTNEVITQVYNDIVDYSTSSFCLAVLPDDIVLRKKTLNEITSKINYTAHHTCTSQL